VRYLHQLCLQATRGGFVPNLGLKVRAERERRHAETAQRHREAREREGAGREGNERPHREHPLADIRKALGMRPYPGGKKP